MMRNRPPEHLATLLSDLGLEDQVVVFRLRNTPALDATGLGALEDVTNAIRKTGRHVLVCGTRSQPLAVIRRAGFDQRLGKENVCHSVSQALERAAALHAQAPGRPSA